MARCFTNTNQTVTASANVLNIGANTVVNSNTNAITINDASIVLNRRGGEPPADMMAVYKYLHTKAIDKAASIKILWSMFNEKW